MKLAFTCKFILTNKQKPVQTSLKGTGTCLLFSLNSETLIKLGNPDDLYVPAHNFAKFLSRKLWLVNSVVERNYFLRFRFLLLKSFGSGSGSGSDF
jgi:hypothetical protein